MKIKLVSVCILFLLSFKLQAQVGIGTTSPDASSVLDITATDKGVLVPRVSLTNVTNTTTPVATPATGLLVWNTNAAVTGGNGVGFYFFNGTQWMPIQQVTSDDDRINNLADGKSDADGSQDGSSIFLGIGAGANDDSSDNKNVGIGYQSLLSNTFGYNNIAVGHSSLSANINGGNNIAIGYNSLNLNSSGSSNVSIGNNSLRTNTTGLFNVAIGGSSLFDNLSGYSNVAIGNSSTPNNTTGYYNVALGEQSMFSNTIGYQNVAIGRNSLYSNSTGFGNVAIGYNAGLNETGSNKLYIENSNSSIPLIYGEFDNNIIRINGEIQVSNPSTTGYVFPVVDGTANQLMQTDGAGNVSWVNPSTLNVLHSIDDLLDGKSDSDGSQDGSSIFLGVGAGANDDSSDNKNVGIGYQALTSNTLGGANVAIGYQSLSSSTTSNNSVAIGYRSLFNSTGVANTAVGSQSLYFNTTGYNNTAFGSSSLYTNTTGFYNTALGTSALRSNTTASRNTAIGTNTLRNNTTGSNNTSLGMESLFSNTTGNYNVASGYQALYSNTTGFSNTANGFNTLYYNTTGFGNIAIGGSALVSNVTGNTNVAIGISALNSNISGNANVAIGNEAGFNETGSNKLYIENSNANANNSLIYGEFGSDNTTTGNLLRTNSVFQIGNPSNTGYAFPTIDGTANQIMQTDGAGNLSWITPSIGDLTTFTANNGLNYNGAANSFRLGGNLLENTTITQGIYGMTFNLNSTGDFVVQDAGIPHFQVSDTGISYFGDNTQWRDNNALTGTLFAQIYDDADDGAMVLYENGLTQILFDANGMSVFNEQGFDRDFRVESLNRTSALHIDASVDVVRVGSATGNLNSNNTMINGITVDYVVDFDNSQATGTALGIGSVEYLLDGNNMTHINTSFAPISHLNLDLGGGSTLAWDDVWADDFWNISDSRAKESVSDLDYGLDEILSMNPVSYKLKDDPFKDQKLGLMAQDVLKLVPEAVKTHDYKVLNENNLDAYSKIELERMGISYTTLIPVLINAIKEQQEQIEQLEYENILMETQYQELLTKFNTQQQEINVIKDLLKM